MPTDEDGDEPVPQRLKVVNVLDVCPGRARDPEVGQPIGILILAYKGETEQGLSFSMSDVRRLAIGFLQVMSHFDDSAARQCLDHYFPEHSPDP
jgi:hypothetical protein